MIDLARIPVRICAAGQQETGLAGFECADPGAAGPELAAGLLAFCRAELATYKCPRTVDFTAELPRDPNGKLYKRLLRERYWHGHDSLVS